MFKSSATALFLSAFFASSAIADDNLVVVELFTSQGCSSCPPADALMHDLAKREDVIGLALHVDYWDYIGWKDEYADPSHAKRQRAYAREGGRTMIYTPQMIINGQEDVVGAKAAQLSSLIAKHLADSPAAKVDVARTGNDLVIEVKPALAALNGAYDIQVVQYSPMRHASIKRGELAGHDLNYANVVESWQSVGKWNGAEPLTLSATLTSELPAAVLVQRAGYGPIVAAARAE